MYGKASEESGAGEHGGSDKAVGVVDAAMFLAAGYPRISSIPSIIALRDAVFQHISISTQRGQTGLDCRA